MVISEDNLKKIYKSCNDYKIKTYCEAFNKVFPLFDVTTPNRVAAFLGQVGSSFIASSNNGMYWPRDLVGSGWWLTKSISVWA